MVAPAPLHHAPPLRWTARSPNASSPTAWDLLKLDVQEQLGRSVHRTVLLIVGGMLVFLGWGVLVAAALVALSVGTGATRIGRSLLGPVRIDAG